MVGDRAKLCSERYLEVVGGLSIGASFEHISLHVVPQCVGVLVKLKWTPLSLSLSLSLSPIDLGSLAPY